MSQEDNLQIETKMFCLNICCICLNKSDLKHMFDVDNDGVSYYYKLTSSIAEMNFKEMNDQRLICGECCVTLNSVYNFRQTCLRSKTNLITYIAYLQTFSNVSDTTNNPSKEIKSASIFVKQEVESNNENEDTPDCFEENNRQNELLTESYEESILFPASVKEECESEEDVGSAREDATADHVNEDAYSDLKVEVEEQTLMDENYIEFTQIVLKDDPLAEVKEEPVSDTESPQDGSTSQADAETSGEPMESETNVVTTGPKKRLHKCEICKKTFKSNFRRHLRIHSGERPFTCETCKRGFIDKGSYNRHLRIHSSERPYQCEICNKTFDQSSTLATHLQVHAGYRPFKCDVCMKCFSRENDLAKHRKFHIATQYECKICKKVFARQIWLASHMLIHLGKMPYECKICKKGFKQQRDLNIHMPVHTGKCLFKCKICKKSFRQKKSLSRHMKESNHI